MTHDEIKQALLALRPNAQWALHGTDLEWLDTEQTCPTEEEILNWIEGNL